MVTILNSQPSLSTAVRGATLPVSGLVLTATPGASTFSISGGKLSFFDRHTDPDRPIEKTLRFDGGDFPLPALLQTNTAVYVGVDSQGELIYSTSAPNLDSIYDALWLGFLSSQDGGQTLSGGGVTMVDSSDATVLALSLGALNIDETALQPIAGGLTARLPETRLYIVGRNWGDEPEQRRSPNITPVPAADPAALSYLSQTGQIISFRGPAFDFTQWDNNGTLEPVPGDAATVQRVYLGAAGGIAILPGQRLFRNFEDMLAELPKTTFNRPAILNGFIQICSIVARGDATDGSSEKVVVIPAGRFGQKQAHPVNVWPEKSLIKSPGSIHFSCRAYLRKGQNTSFDPIYGPNFHNALNDVGSSPTAANLAGWVIPYRVELRSLRLRHQPTTDSANVTWEQQLHVVRASTGTVETTILGNLAAPTQTVRNDEFLFAENQIVLEPGDLLSISSRRLSTGGSGTYYVALSGAFEYQQV